MCSLTKCYVMMISLISGESSQLCKEGFLKSHSLYNEFQTDTQAGTLQRSTDGFDHNHDRLLSLCCVFCSCCISV